MSGNAQGSVDPPVTSNQTPRLVASWLIVGAPLAWGVYQTISKTLALFGG